MFDLYNIITRLLLHPWLLNHRLQSSLLLHHTLTLLPSLLLLLNLLPIQINLPLLHPLTLTHHHLLPRKRHLLPLTNQLLLEANSLLILPILSILSNLPNLLKLGFDIITLRPLFFHLYDGAVDCVREGVEGGAVGHAELHGFLEGYFGGLVVAEALPLRVDGVDGAAGEEALFYEALPINLILILPTRKLLSNLEYLDQLPHSKPSPLPR